MVPGLSPHARGNPLCRRGRAGFQGSIPARAGQPSGPSCRGRPMAVYPRTRGATHRWLIAAYGVEGLSPHARGNHSRRRGDRPPRRSIPARAGQPLLDWDLVTTLSVYPRTRGATLVGLGLSDDLIGLSPHARGNHCFYPFPFRHYGSIPARAGQPCHSHSFQLDSKVYPRTRGATTLSHIHSMPHCGLSPHARGNPGLRMCHIGVLRSIPARAGQPTRESL